MSDKKLGRPAFLGEGQFRLTVRLDQRAVSALIRYCCRHQCSASEAARQIIGRYEAPRAASRPRRY